MPERTPGRRVIVSRIITPALTLQTSPLFTPVSLGQVTLEALELTIPTGHVGLTGFAVRIEDRTLVPWADTEDWIRGNGETHSWNIDFDVRQPVIVATFNEDLFDHAHYVRWIVSETPLLARAEAVVVPRVRALSGGPS